MTDLSQLYSTFSLPLNLLNSLFILSILLIILVAVEIIYVVLKIFNKRRILEDLIADEVIRSS